MMFPDAAPVLLELWWQEVASAVADGRPDTFFLHLGLAGCCRGFRYEKKQFYLYN